MKILLISGHPDRESFSHALAQAYKKGALIFGAEVRSVRVRI